MADVPTETDRDDTAARTFDAEAHGESAERMWSRSTPVGEVRTQRGNRGDVPAEVLAHGYEIKDLSPRGVSYALLGFIVSIALSGAFVGGLLLLFRDVQERPLPPPLVAKDLVPPQPRLEVSPQADRARLEAEAMARLAGYGWVDRGAGRARIPIERAMQLLAEHGWPDPVDTAQEGSQQVSAGRSSPPEAERSAERGGTAAPQPKTGRSGAEPGLETRP